MKTTGHDFHWYSKFYLCRMCYINESVCVSTCRVKMSHKYTSYGSLCLHLAQQVRILQQLKQEESKVKLLEEFLIDISKHYKNFL